MCVCLPPPRYWAEWTKKDHFYVIFAAESDFVVEIRKKRVFLHIPCKNSKKNYVFQVRKKPEGDGKILTLDSDSATQNP